MMFQGDCAIGLLDYGAHDGIVGMVGEPLRVMCIV